MKTEKFCGHGTLPANLMVPKKGIWNIEVDKNGNETIVSGGGILVFEEELVDFSVIEARFTSPNQLNRNGYIIFNYDDEENYSFVGGDIKLGEWMYGVMKDGKNTIKFQFKDVFPKNRFDQKFTIEAQWIEESENEFEMSFTVNDIFKFKCYADLPTNVGLAASKCKTRFEYLFVD